MLEVPVYNTKGEKVDTMQVDEAVFGGEVKPTLLKQALVAYHGNRRQGSAANRSRGMVAGSTRKLFRQKGTGSARRGAIRTHKVRGGGVAFAKVPYKSRRRLPRKMRKAALNTAILAKILAGDFCVLDGLGMDAPKTREMAGILKSLGIDRRCLLALKDRDANVYLSSRNLPDLTVRTADELNAFDVAMRPRMVVTSEAMKALMNQEEQA
ncbi:MAG: 50S ribosomal protein L4 [Phycisphaerae bacterium]